VGIFLLLLTAFLSLIWAGMICIAIAGIVFKERQKKYGSFNKKAIIIVPCKGIDLTLQKNLRAIKKEENDKIKAVAVVDDVDDESVSIINKTGFNFIVSSNHYKDCSGKVAAICTAIEKFKDYSAYVIIDSDVQCFEGHVKDLLAPLSDPNIGISTAYPYFNPANNFWSHVKMAWGFVGNGMMESKTTRFGWGGSIAFRKDLIGKKEMVLLSKAISDDMALVHMAKEKNLGIAYVDNGKIQVNIKESRRSFFEWSTRQTALSILGNRRLLYMGLSLYLAQIILLALGILLALAVSPYYLILLLPFALNVWKTFKRARKKFKWLLPISLIINFIFLWNLVKASGMKSIFWRGRTYPLKNPF